MTIKQFAFVGDSLVSYGTNGAFSQSQGGLGCWVDGVTDRLGNLAGLGPLVGPGLRLVLTGNTPANPEWVYTGSWTGVASTDAFDKAPYGALVGGAAVTFYGNGSGLSVKWTKPAFMPSIVGFSIYWIDYTSGGNWSYRIDGGAWTAMGQTLANDNKLCKFYIATAVTTSVEIRCANAAGTGVGCLPVGIEPFYLDPTTASGLIVHNLAIGSTTLHALTASTSGDRLAWFDQVKLGTGSPIVNTPAAGICMMHINDVQFVNNTTTWATDLTTLNTRVSPLGTVGFINPYEVTTASYNQTSQTNYRAQTKTTGAGFGTPAKVFDIYDAWVSLGFTGNTGANTAGFVYTDLLHESQRGHLDLANRLYWFIRNNFFSAYSGPTTYPETGKKAAVAYTGKSAAGAFSAGQPITVVPV